MCGIVAYVGKPEPIKLRRLIYESGVRGLHHFGAKFSPDERAGIFHARYITSGETHQPLTFGERSMVFNGVIDMGTKREMELKYGIDMVTDNDGEIILQLCATAEEAVEFLGHTKATFAGVWLEKNELIALRNAGRPLWICEKTECVYITSTKDIFRRSGFTGPCQELEPNKIYRWTI